MNQGFILLHRQLLDWEWYDHIPTKVLFIHCLLRANHTDGVWRGQPFKRGEFITSIQSLSKETGLTVKQVRASLHRLILGNQLGKQTTNLNTLISVVNYDKYQSEGKQKGKGRANEGQQIKNDNNEINIDIRKQEFAARVKSFESKYPIEMLREFYLYWSEHSDNGKKMRFEMQKVFNIERRLITWGKNQQKFDPPKQVESDTRVDHVTSNIKKYYPDYDTTKRTQ